MTTENNTLFKFNDGYIRLEDLENWYSNGLITHNDRIRIFENGGKRMGIYKIDTLIQIYGEHHPFRRIPRICHHNAYSSSEEESENNLSGNQENLIIPVSSLRLSNPDVWPDEYTNQISVTHDSDKKLFSPKSEHTEIANGDRRKLVDLYKWKTQRGKVCRRPRNDPPIPLLDAPTHKPILTRRRYKEKYAETCEFLKTYVPNEKTTRKVDCECHHCPGNTKMSSQWEVVQHIFNGRHSGEISELGSAADFTYYKTLLQFQKPQPVPFPCTGLTQAEKRSALKQNKKLEKQKVLIKNHPRFPLLDSPSNYDDLISKKEYKTKYKQIQEQLKTMQSTEETDKKVQLTCYHCHRYPIFRTIWEAMQHIFGDQHYANLRNAAESSDFEYFEKICAPKPAVDVLVENRKSLNFDYSVFKFPEHPDPLITKDSLTEREFDEEVHDDFKLFDKKKRTVAVATLTKKDKTFQKEKLVNKTPLLYLPPSQSRWIRKHNLPLMERPPAEVITCTSGIFSNNIEKMQKKLPAVRKAAKHQKVYWICEYCSSAVKPLVVTSILQTFEHIISEEHQKKMKFTAPLSDLQYWTGWAIQLVGDVEIKKN